MCNYFDEFEQLNSGWLISSEFNCMGDVNQFEIKERCIEFVTKNVSPQGNVKIKLNLKVVEICRNCSPNFLWSK